MTRKIDTLQGLRFIAFLGVFIWHLNGYMGLKTTPLAFSAVTFFIVLAGFVSMLSIDKHLEKLEGNILRKSFLYTKKKMSKIYPLYILTIIMYIPLSFKHLVLDINGSIVYYLLLIFVNIFLLQAWKIKNFNAISYSGWYLSIVLFLNFVTIFLYKFIQFMNKKNNIIKNVILILFTFGLFYFYNLAYQNSDLGFYFYVFPVYGCFGYFIGMCIANVYKKIKNFNLHFIIASILEIILIIIAINLIKKSLIYGYGYNTSMLNISAAALLIIAVMLQKGIISKILSLKPFVFLGNISGEMYLIHGVMIAYVFGVLQRILPHNDFTKICAVLLVFGLTILSSAFVHYKIYKNFKKNLKTIYFKIFGPIKRRKFKYTDFTIISNNCFGGIVYRNNAIPYNTPTAGLFFMADDYIKFIYDMKNYLNKELIEVKIEDSKHYNYLKQINYSCPIGKLGDVEIMFLHYPNFEEAKQKWIRRTKRINYDKIIYKFSEQNECTYEHLKKFNRFNASNKLCFTYKKYNDINSIQFIEFENNPKLFSDSSEKIFKKYINIYDYVNRIETKPRVLMVVSDLAKCNGITSYAMNYFNNIDLTKVEIDFVVTSDNIDEIYKNDILSKNRNIHIVNYDSNSSIIKNAKTIKEFMRKNSSKYNIIHSNLINKGYFYLKYAKKYGIKVRILHSHNATLGDGNFIKRIINVIFKNLAIKNANRYIACSNLAGKFLFGKKKFTVINNAVNVNKFVYDERARDTYRKELGLEDKFVIGQVGRLDIQKNHLFFVNVINELVKTNKSIVWLVVGNGSLEDEIKSRVKELNLENNVMFLGSRSDVNKLYSAMDIFVLPSLYEGLSLVAVEAQISGISSILSSEITEETKILQSLEFVPLDENEWVEAIKNKDISISRKNTKNDVIKAGYNIEVEAKKVENMYINMING